MNILIKMDSCIENCHFTEKLSNYVLWMRRVVLATHSKNT